MKKLTQEYLKSRVHYDPETGIFTHLPNPGKDRFTNAWNARFAGKKAGFLKPNGYAGLRIDGVNYQAHRMAFLYMVGRLPRGDIDHVNHVRNDNVFSNLREASRQENQRNRSLVGQSSSGVMGVCWDADRKKWMAKIKVDGRSLFLGRFKSLKAAAAARKAAEKRYGFHENHGAAAA